MDKELREVYPVDPGLCDARHFGFPEIYGHQFKNLLLSG